eukprot:4051870-Pyramimonas_sp.AAC.1
MSSERHWSGTARRAIARDLLAVGPCPGDVGSDCLSSPFHTPLPHSYFPPSSTRLARTVT